jgi:hypothetical protein
MENNGGSRHSGGGSTLRQSEPDRLPIVLGLLWTADFKIFFAVLSFYPSRGGDKPEHAVVVISLNMPCPVLCLFPLFLLGPITMVETLRLGLTMLMNRKWLNLSRNSHQGFVPL